MSIEVDMDEVTVSTDEKWVIFILGQIFSNSRKYRRPAGAKIRISMKTGERQKSLVIEDNGRGIPAEDLGSIFQKGFTGKNGRDARLLSKQGDPHGVPAQSRQSLRLRNRAHCLLS